VYGSTDIYTIQVFDVESGELILTILQDFQYFVTDLAWNAAGTHLATSSRSISGGEVYSNIGIYKIEPYEPPFIDSTFWRRNIGYYGFTAQIDWHPTDYILAYASEDAIEIYDPSQEGALLTIAVDEAKDIEWSPDGTQIASVSRDGTLAIWDVSL
jgi:WD40 repeat protein